MATREKNNPGSLFREVIICKRLINLVCLGLLLGIVGSGQTANAAVTVGQDKDAMWTGGDSNIMSFNWVVGLDSCLVVMVAGEWNPNDTQVSSITFGTQSLIQAVACPVGTGGNNYTDLWYLVDPNGDDDDITVTMSTSVVANDAVIEAVILHGIDQTNPLVDTAQWANADSAAASVSIYAVEGGILIDSFQQNSGGRTPTPSSGQTVLYVEGGIDGGASAAGGYRLITANGTMTEGWSVDNPNQRNVLAVASFAPVCADFFTLIDQWLASDCDEDNFWCNRADCDGTYDGDVNLFDFTTMAANWREPEPGIFVLESTKLRIILTRSPYSFTITEKSTDQTLLSQQETRFMLGGSGYIAQSAYNITTTAFTMDADIVLVGTSETGHVTFSLESPEMVRVLLSCNDTTPSNIREKFIDQGEHYYGIWERPQGGSIDSRGADKDLIGFPGEPDDNARAPFYVTSGKYGIYVDTVAFGHYSIAINGKTSFDFDEGQLTYYVIYGPDYANILNVYNDLAGPAWMPPDWAFDSIWWRNDDHTDLDVHWDLVENRLIDSAQDNVEATANHLQYYRIPASAIWIDRPYTSGTWGWGNMDFNPAGDWFPDGTPKGQAMIDYLDAKGYNLLLWIANRCENTLLTEGLANGYLFTGYTSRPAADMRIPNAYNWFQNHLDTFVTMGIKGYKIDRGHQSEHPLSLENENVYLFHKMSAEGQMARHDSDYLIHARNTFDKSRKYVGVWNGDIPGNYGGLARSIKNGLRCGAINFPYFGTDTGGYGGAPSRELFTRWFQFSTYCTMMEIFIDPDRAVWYDSDYSHADDPNLIDIARKQCEDHHDLIPYTKSCMYQANQTGMPVMRQMIFEFPYDSNLYDMWDEYMYGPGILVAPVVTGGAASRNVYLPAGKWLDYNDKDTAYTGPSTITASAPLDTIPLFVREGAIITRGDILQANNNWTPGWAPYLRIEFFPYDNTANTFDYYTGSNVRPIACSMPDTSNVNISFLDLGYAGTLEIYCRAYTAVTQNSTPLTEGMDFTYDPVKNLMTIPFSGPTTVEMTGVQSIFNPD